ncbi:cellulose binding domain-containing protein [Micromonospora sp. WMMD882]|uniref:cellulose binding domain-containing protein n=1 Tax=Micromonospora sp. WMMD882 TaxID=3015151 RepID=UPI00248BA9A5|nr:cellulose binding domain-containing protein [Micromonospora sp. WMMD882]WBB81998.1 cellulose binding domain-containing protein [Micromonospora sp. WMMD882]
MRRRLFRPTRLTAPVAAVAVPLALLVGVVTTAPAAPAADRPAAATPTTPSVPLTPPPTSPPPDETHCYAFHQTVGRWPGGFQGRVTVRNVGLAPSRSWTVTFTLPDGHRVRHAWHTRLTQSGTTVTAANTDHNGALFHGEEAVFGFLATATSAPTEPTLTCTAD